MLSEHPLAPRFWSDKNEYSIDSFTYGSQKKGWWVCDFGHETFTEIRTRVKALPLGCPVCSGKVVVKGINDLATTHPHLESEWAGSQDIGEFSAGSNKRVEWKCSLGHDFSATIIQRAKRGTGCPYCSGQKVLSGFNDLDSQYPDIAKTLSGKNEKVAGGIGAKSGTKYIWECSNGHEWKTSVYARTQLGHGCPTCAGRSVLHGINDLKTHHPNLMDMYSSENIIRPEDLARQSNKSVVWECSSGHNWTRQVYQMVRSQNCPVCKSFGVSQGEREMGDFIESLGVSIERNNRTVIAPLELDVYLPDCKIGVEYNGLYWHSLPGNNDERKRRVCKEKGIDLLTITDEEWLRSREEAEDHIRRYILERVDLL